MPFPAVPIFPAIIAIAFTTPPKITSLAHGKGKDEKSYQKIAAKVA